MNAPANINHVDGARPKDDIAASADVIDLEKRFSGDAISSGKNGDSAAEMADVACIDWASADRHRGPPANASSRGANASASGALSAKRRAKQNA